VKQKKSENNKITKLSLAPLNFEEALTSILAVSPPPKEKKPTKKKKVKKS